MRPPAPVEEALPTLRGLLHQHALWFAAAAALTLVALAPTPGARIAAAIYGAGLCCLFGASALYHRWPGHPRWKPLLRRIDHSTIFVFIAASSTPVAALVLKGSLGVVMLAVAWGSAAAGVLLSVAWIDAPRILSALTYIACGWAAVAGLPKIVEGLGIAPTVLFVVGGALYSLGAVVYALQRPDPWPRVFGFHEVFHTLVIAAAVVHFVAIAGWVIPHAG